MLVLAYTAVQWSMKQLLDETEQQQVVWIIPKTKVGISGKQQAVNSFKFSFIELKESTINKEET